MQNITIKMKTKRKCPICKKEIYTGMYCTDCMYKDTSTIPKFERKILDGITKKQVEKNVFVNVNEKDLKRIIRRMTK